MSEDRKNRVGSSSAECFKARFDKQYAVVDSITVKVLQACEASADVLERLTRIDGCIIERLYTIICRKLKRNRSIKAFPRRA